MLNYKGLRGRLERLTVSDAQVDRQIEELIEQNPQIIPVTDRPSRLDDEVVLDYSGTCDGVRFEGGTAENQVLTLGSGMFIPGFEDQLVGVRPGDAVDVRVTFPAQYHAGHLAGKDAVFHCVIHEIRQRRKYVPGDDFAREVFGLSDFEALKSRLREGMQTYADQQAREDLCIRLLNDAMADYECEVTPAQLDAAMDQQLRALEAQLARQGLTLDAYCQFTGKTRDQLREEHAPDARQAVRRQRAIAEIARAEAIQADEASVAEAIQEICRQNNLTIDQLSAHMTPEAQDAVVRNVITKKVLDRILELSIIEEQDDR